MRKNCLDYPVEFIEDAFGDSSPLAQTLKEVSGREDPKLLIVADSNVVQRTAELGVKIGRYVRDRSITLAATPVVVGGGEKVKSDNLQSVMKVISVAVESGVGPGDAVLAIGGGAVLDVAGYAASAVRGGVGVVRMPTTPAAMMGSAFSEAAAVDFAGRKDVLKTPSVPAAVVVDVSFAATVLDGVWKGGIAEAARLAAACDATLADKIRAFSGDYARRDMSALRKIIKAVYDVRKKKGACDYGETIAARLQMLSSFKIPHGYALAIGVLVCLARDVECAQADEKTFSAVSGLLGECGALEGLVHSRHLLERKDELFAGLEGADAYSRSVEKVISLGA